MVKKRVLKGVVAALAVAMIVDGALWVYTTPTPESVGGILGVFMGIALLLLENMRS